MQLQIYKKNCNYSVSCTFVVYIVDNSEFCGNIYNNIILQKLSSVFRDSYLLQFASIFTKKNNQTNAVSPYESSRDIFSVNKSV